MFLFPPSVSFVYYSVYYYSFFSFKIVFSNLLKHFILFISTYSTILFEINNSIT